MDLQGKTISAPSAGVLNYSNGTINGDITPRSGSVFRNVTINGNIYIDQNIDGVEITHCFAKSFNSQPPQYSMKNILIQASIFEPTDNGAFTCVFSQNPSDNFVVTDCILRNAREGLHILDGKQGLTGCIISYNEVTQIRRHGLEVQIQANGAICQGNLLHNWRKNLGDSNTEAPSDSHLMISWACGPNAAFNYNSQNCQIIDNVIIGDGETQWPIVTDAWKNGGIEWMGDNGLVARNYIKNFGGNAYTFCRNLKSQNNIWIGNKQGPWDDETGNNPAAKLNWHDAPQISGDKRYDLNDTNQPPQPKAGPRVVPGPGNMNLPSSSSLPIVITPDDEGNKMTGPTIVSAESIGNGQATITLANTAGNGVINVSAKSTKGQDPLVKVGDLVDGTTSFTVQNAPKGWEIDLHLTFTLNGQVSAESVITYQDDGGGQVLNSVNLSLLSAVVSAPTPVPTVTTKLVKITFTYSDGSTKDIAV